MKKVLFLLTLSAGAYGAAAIHPTNLRCEYLTNPQGIDVVEPRLSWILAGSPTAHGLHQTAYRIVVTGAADVPLWDTGKVDSGQSIQVVYRGKPLTSGATASWKVQVWDQDGKPSDWSPAAQWSMWDPLESTCRHASLSIL